MSTTVAKRGKPPLNAKRRAAKHKRVQRYLAQHKTELILHDVPLSDMPVVDAGEAMQNLLNHATFLWRAAVAEVNLLQPGIAQNQADHEHELWAAWDEDGNLVINHNYWVERESVLRDQLAKLTESAQKLELGERRARVKEAQILLVGEALRQALADSGVDENTQRLVGGNLRLRLEQAATA